MPVDYGPYLCDEFAVGGVDSGEITICRDALIKDTLPSVPPHCHKFTLNE